MTNLQAALGLAQLEQLERFIEVKENNYNLYKEKINKIPGLSIFDFKYNIRSNHWFYSLKCEKTYPMDRDEIIRYLDSNKIQSRPIWGLINEQKPYIESQSYKVERAKYYVEHIVNIPCSSNLTREDLLYVVECLKSPTASF